MRRWVRNRGHRTALMIDIDCFKGINENFGRQAGKKVLQCVAQTIAAMVCKQDLARRGGEEFVVLFSNTDMSGARRLGKSLDITFRSWICGQLIE
ncbi:MAG: GGDEF domain-containing protein [Gammaproteobacteria bacterium]